MNKLEPKLKTGTSEEGWTGRSLVPTSLPLTPKRKLVKRTFQALFLSPSSRPVIHIFPYPCPTHPLTSSKTT